MKLEEIEKIVKSKLSEERYFHSKCVMERAIEIAKMFEYSEEIAAKVGIAHDIAKEIDNDKKIKYAEQNNIAIDDIERDNPTLLHAKLGEDIAIKEFGFSKEMGQAIRAHTTGIPEMDLLAKILFIADRTSKERELPDIDDINNLMMQSIDRAVLYILDKKIQLQIQKKAQMHPDSIITRNWLLKNGINL